MDRPPMEPAADLRQLASTLRQMFVALTTEGFSDDEALKVIGHILAANGGGGR